MLWVSTFSAYRLNISLDMWVLASVHVVTYFFVPSLWRIAKERAPDQTDFVHVEDRWNALWDAETQSVEKQKGLHWDISVEKAPVSSGFGQLLSILAIG